MMERMNYVERTPDSFESGKNVSIASQIKILVVKNWLCKRRTEFKKLLGEICLPVFYLIILSFLVRLQPHKIYPEVKESYETPSNVLNSLLQYGSKFERYTIHVVHSSQTHSANIAELMLTIWNSTYPKHQAFQFEFHPNVSELMEEYSNLASKINVAVVLSENDTFTYTIRINPDRAVFPTPGTKKAETETCRGRNKLEEGLESVLTCPVNGYYHSNFLAVQYLVDNALILKSLENSTTEHKPAPVMIENYPKAEYTPGMSTTLRVIIPIYCIIPLAQLINTLLILIVTEKENKIKDGLKMIGVSDVAYWCSWFFLYGAMAVIFSAMFTVVMHFMNVLKNISPVILFLLFMLFGFSIITFAFSLTPFFHKPKTAGAVGTVIMQFTSMLFLLQTFLLDSSSAIMMPLRLISSVAFTTALDDACAYEYSGGIAVSDLLPGRRGAGVMYSLIFLAFDTILYALFAMYLDNVIPNEYGVRKHPFFFLQPSFWVGKSEKYLQTQSMDDVESIGNCSSDDVEKVHPSMIGKESFRIRNLKKTYSSWPSKTVTEAVKGVSLDIYDGQITALIGRNGAGKSTLVNMMTGLVSPSGGRCVAFGLDISDPYDMMKLRKMTGVCMQQDLHFASMSVQEHLEFYGHLRGIQEMQLQTEITELLEELDLTEQRRVHASKLSGGQKRKLSVGIALIGSPKVILLDEPSAGVDPVSRRQLWSVLQRKKAGRVILLTTHFMDEADVLADRKAIIHNGSLRCVGSSLFLKSRFGVGYHLSVELDETKVASSTKSDEIIQKWIPDAMESRNIIANEIKYALPHSEVSKFADMFGDFEASIALDSSNIKSYGVSMTTLSEVFLKIANDMDSTDRKQIGNESMPHRRMSNTSHSSSTENAFDNNSCDQGQNLIPNVGEMVPNPISVFSAVCLLRIRRLIRSPQSLFFLVFMPVILVAVGFAIVKSQTIGSQVGQITFATSQVSQIYSGQDFAISENSDKGFSGFLNKSGIPMTSYSGNYADLLDLNVPNGTMAALKIDPVGREASVRINGTYLHVPGILVNALNQYSLQSVFQGATPNIMTVNQPLPSKSLANLDQSAFYAAFLIGPAFTFSAVGMVMEIVNDREKQTRNHLRVNGLSFKMYFSSIFFVFGMLSVLITLMEIIVIFAFSVTAFTNPYAITVVIILLILFIVPCLLFSAALSYMFDRMETAQSVFSQICSWTGSIIGIAMILIDAFAPKQALMCHYIFSALDIFYIPFGIFYWTNKQYLTCTILSTCDELSFKNYLGPEFIAMGVAMLLQIPVFGLFLLIADIMKNGGTWTSVLRTLKLRPTVLFSGGRVNSASPDLDGVNEDDDVKNEKNRVAEYFSSPRSSSLCVVAVQDLCKSYKCKTDKQDGPVTGSKYYQKKVLRGMDMMVEEGEVFGLLGHNGAGKTSTIKLIIAEEKADYGNIRLCGQDIQSNVSDAFQKLGYCPQHDALWDNITLQEHMELYAVIRGVHPSMRKKLVDHFLKGLQIEEHAKKKSETLSGGTKRKLSYCMSMLGSPKIVLLDEPSTGMDIVSKRFLWNTVIGTFKDNRGAILTTHSMEEADALCTRIGIMVKGTLLCIGSPQHLKSKHGDGYTLEIKLMMDDAAEMEIESSGQFRRPSQLSHIHLNSQSNLERFAFVQQYFPGIKLNEIFENRAIYSIPKSSIMSISKTFSLLQSLKRDHNIEEYSFSQTTLEQVFLQFAKNNEDNS